MGDVYSTVAPQAPYVVAAYTLIWVTFIAYVAFAFRRLSRVEKELSVLEESVARRGAPGE